MNNTKFEIGLKKDNNGFLKYNKFYEKLPLKELLFLRQNIQFTDYNLKKNKDIFYQYQVSQNINNNKEHLDLYISKNNNGYVPIKYFNIFDDYWGKMINNGIFFLDTGNSSLRKNILDKYYYNFDLNSSEFSIFRESCKKIGVTCPVIDFFIKYKKEIRKYIIDYYSLEDEKVCKDIIYSIYSVENNLSDYYARFNLDTKKKVPKILVCLKREIDRIFLLIKKYNPELWEYSSKTKIYYGNNYFDIKNKKFRNYSNDFGNNNRKAYFLKLYKGEYEKRIITGIIEWLYYNTDVLKSGNKNGVIIYEYDSINILRENVDRQFGDFNIFTDLLNTKTKLLFDLDIKWNCETRDNTKKLEIMQPLKSKKYNYNIFIIAIIIIIGIIYMLKNIKKF